jgi:hypothetical protein
MRTSYESRVISTEHKTVVFESLDLLAQGSHGIIGEFREWLVTIGLGRGSPWHLLTILFQSISEGFIGCQCIHDVLMLIGGGGEDMG